MDPEHTLTPKHTHTHTSINTNGGQQKDLAAECHGQGSMHGQCSSGFWVNNEMNLFLV